MSKHLFLLVHSPLVGPSSLGRLAGAASTAGFDVALPDLTPSAISPRPHEVYRRIAVDAAGPNTSAVTVVGHSGAGAFLPGIGAEIATETNLIFVDAVLPPPVGAHVTSTPMKAVLDKQTDDGLLRAWLSWWPDEVLTELLPNAIDRQQLREDMPRLPRSFYNVDVEVPTGWSSTSCAYLQLSDAYDDEFDEAVLRGWPVARCDSTHLGVYTAADQVFAEIIELDESLR